MGEDGWLLGKPDLIVAGPEVFVPAVAPDKWGNIGSAPTGLTEDRWVKSVEVREINDIPRDQASKTVGGRYVFHHMTYQSSVQGQQGSTSWPIHEVGRNPDEFPDTAGRLLAANSVLELSASHIHANGHDTKSHLEFGFRFFPKGYQPTYRRSGLLLGNGNDLDVKPNTPDQEIHAFATLQEHTKIIAFEPHLHAPGVRMCLEAIWGMNIQQLTCAGYDHNWVKQYIYEDDAAPILPEGHDSAPGGLPRHHQGEQEPGRLAQLGRRRAPFDRQHVHRPRLLGLDDRGAVPGRDGGAARQDEEPQRLRSRLPALLGAARRSADAADVAASAGAAVIRRAATVHRGAVAARVADRPARLRRRRARRPASPTTPGSRWSRPTKAGCGMPTVRTRCTSGT